MCKTDQKIGSFFTERYVSPSANRVIFSRFSQTLSLVSKLCVLNLKNGDVTYHFITREYGGQPLEKIEEGPASTKDENYEKI